MWKAILVLYGYYIIGWAIGIMHFQWWAAFIMGLFIGASFSKFAMFIARSIATEQVEKIKDQIKKEKAKL